MAALERKHSRCYPSPHPVVIMFQTLARDNKVQPREGVVGGGGGGGRGSAAASREKKTYEHGAKALEKESRLTQLVMRL